MKQVFYASLDNITILLGETKPISATITKKKGEPVLDQDGLITYCKHQWQGKTPLSSFAIMSCILKLKGNRKADIAQVQESIVDALLTAGVIAGREVIKNIDAKVIHAGKNGLIFNLKQDEKDIKTANPALPAAATSSLAAAKKVL